MKSDPDTLSPEILDKLADLPIAKALKEKGLNSPQLRIGISFPTELRNFKVGTVSITVSRSLTVVSIPPAKGY